MKRKFLIILIIILTIFAFLFVGWFFARNKASKSGGTPPSFREFIGLGNKKAIQTQDPTNTTTSEFDQTETPTTTSNPPAKSVPTNSSIFTSGGFTPIGVGGGVDPINDSNINTSGGGTSTGTGTTGVGIVINTPVCSDEDTTIAFTPDEINKLNALRNRFFAVAETLRTDTDVATEMSNYDVFKTKSSKIEELYSYCKNSDVFKLAKASPVPPPRQGGIAGISINLPRQPYGSVWPGQNGAINYRVPTPFWRDANKDNDGFVHQGVNFMGVFAEEDRVFFERSAEHYLRINLW